MKKVFTAHYEKLLLGGAAVLLGIFFLLGSSEDTEGTGGGGGGGGGGSDLTLHSEKDGTITLETLTPHGLMPGDEIVISGAEPENFNGPFVVTAIRLPESYEPIEIMLTDGTIVSGEFRQAGQKQLEQGWNRTAHAMQVGMEDKPEPVSVPFARIKHLRASTSLVLAATDEVKSGDSAYGDIKLIAYDDRALASNREGDGRVEWKNETNSTALSEDAPPYDLFTPPVLYVIKGVITSTLPEKPKAVKPPEPFGARLAAFEQVPYRFTIRSWAGEIPYLLDGNQSNAPGSPVSNRINLREPYKLNPAWEPGRPSLIPTNMDDPQKLLMVEHFVVQQVRTETGGIRPVGRVMLKDFTLNKKFEINSLMEKTFAGQYRIRVESDQATFVGQGIEFGHKAAGTDFRLNDRDYRILAIDLEGARVHLQKQALDPRELQVQWLSLPAAVPLESP